jgi:hypothetical protein
VVTRVSQSWFVRLHVAVGHSLVVVLSASSSSMDSSSSSSAMMGGATAHSVRGLDAV